MKINIAKVLQAERERKARVLPVPIIRVRSGRPEAEKFETPEVRKTVETETTDLRAICLSDLDIEMRAIKVERAKLSNTIPTVVEEVSEKLRKEGPGVVEEFLNGNISSPELKELYSKIQGCTDRAMLVYDKIRHVEQYGTLPPSSESNSLPSGQGEVAKALKYEIRRLDDLIHKKYKNLVKAKSGLKAPKNSERVNTWKETIAMAETRRDDLKYKLKNLKYGS